MSSTPRRASSGMSAAACCGCQPVLASTRRGPPYTPRTASSVSMSAGPPTLILRAGKWDARLRPLGDHGGLIDAQRVVGRGQLVRRAEELPDGHAKGLAGEVVEGHVQAGLGGAVVAQDVGHEEGGAFQPGQHGLAVGRQRAELVERAEESRQHGRHRLRGLPVVGQRVALPEAVGALQFEVHGDRAHGLRLLRPRDVEGLAERQVQDLRLHRQGHRAVSSRTVRSRVTSRSGPKRSGSSTVRSRGT